MHHAQQEWVWLNGQIVPMAEARVGVEDRGFQFADGVYEVIRLYDGRPFTLAEYLDRLERSATALGLTVPLARQALFEQIGNLVDRSGVRTGMVYLQLTRGAAPRNHVFPKPAECAATLLFYARDLPPAAEPGSGHGTRLLTVTDERWKRCWIKSVALLPNVLAKNAAVAVGADEAAFVEDGIVSECSASNIFAVIDGRVVTHPVGAKVLPGITRLVLSQVARQIDVPFIERPLRLDEAQSADEVFITSTTRELSWVGKWDDRTVGGGRCGPVTLRLHRAYQQRVLATVGPGAYTDSAQSRNTANGE